MRRREFIAVLGGATAWPLMARAQQSGKMPRIGILWHAGNEQEEAPFLGALRKGLNDLGYIEGKNIELLNRFADEHYDRFDPFARELVEAKVDVIVASIPGAANAAKRATTTIPVVVAYGAEYLVQELAHPGEISPDYRRCCLIWRANNWRFLRLLFPTVRLWHYFGTRIQDFRSTDHGLKRELTPFEFLFM